MSSKLGRRNKFLSTLWLKISVITGCWLIPVSSFAVSLQNIEYSSLPNQGVEIRFIFDETPPQPHIYRIPRPARIAMDLTGVTNDTATKKTTLGLDNAQSIMVLESKGRTRVVINLNELMNYESRIENNQIYLRLGDSSESDSVAISPTTVAVDQNKEAQALVSSIAKKKTPKISGKAIKNIDFRRTPTNGGAVVIDLTNPKILVDVSEKGSRIYVKFLNASLPMSLQQRLDVSDFATPVQTIDARPGTNSTTIIIESAGSYDYLAYQSQSQYTINIEPKAPEEIDEAKKKLAYYGNPMNMNFQDMEVRQVLFILADYNNLSLVAGDNVQGRITIRLNDVPWDQALDAVLRMASLDKRLDGKVLSVGPADEMAEREKLLLESQRQRQELAPLVTEFIPVRYAKATDIAEVIRGKGTDGKGDAESGGLSNLLGSSGGLAPAAAASSGGAASAKTRGLLSSRGSVSVDERTNILIVQDIEDKISEIRRMLKELDKPVSQVLIEARVVTANSSFGEQIGIRWGGLYFGNQTGDMQWGGGSLQTVDDIRNPDENGAITFESPDHLVVDMGVTDTNATSVALGFLANTGMLELELSALENSGNGEVIAQPKVTTQDKKTASIKSGVQIPYLVPTVGGSGGSGGATTFQIQFIDAVLSLDVTPQITPDGNVIMDLEVHQDSIGATVNSVPGINTNVVETRVLVEDGGTIVLGGVFREEVSNTTIKTPILGDIPYLGRLFKKTIKDHKKTELLIFITPKIIKDITNTIR